MAGGRLGKEEATKLWKRRVEFENRREIKGEETEKGGRVRRKGKSESGTIRKEESEKEKKKWSYGRTWG